MVAVPTRAVAGQAAAASGSGWQRVEPPVATAADTEAGSVTAALNCELSPTACVMVATNGTCELIDVAPGPPISARTFGANGSWSQLVGVKVLDAWDVVPGSSCELASMMDVAALHEVGLDMNGVLSHGRVPNSVIEVEVIWSGRPDTVLGWLLTGESMPKSPLVRRLTGDLRKIFPPADGRTTIPRIAGWVASGTRL